MTEPSAVGVRSTRQREAIAALLQDSPGFRTAQELHAELRRRGEKIGLTTVYRTLQALAEGGHADSLRIDGGELAYRLCDDTHHHHHLVCRECGHTEEIAGETVERWTRDTAEAHGFTDVEHVVELFGRCATCSAG